MNIPTFNIKKILVPVNISTIGESFQQNVILYATKAKAEVVLIVVLDGPEVKHEEMRYDPLTHDHFIFDDTRISETRRQLDKYKALFTDKGITTSYIIERGKPYKKIPTIAKAILADIIILDCKDTSIAREEESLDCGDAFKIISEAACPVLSIKNMPVKGGIENILLPFHDKPHSRESVEYAIYMAKLFDATLHILGTSYDTSDEGVNKIQLEADQIKQILEERNIKNTINVTKGKYDSKLIDIYAERYSADMLIIMADVDKRSITEYIIGPVLEKLINHSEIPVLSIRPAYNAHILESESEPVNSVSWKFWN